MDIPMNLPLFYGKKPALQSWKDLRVSLSKDNSDYEHLKKTVNWWSSAPLSKNVLNWDVPQEWPDPWQMIYNGNFDESCLAVGMFYTLLFANDNRWDPTRLKLFLILDKGRQLQQIVLDVDDCWLLNLEYNSIINKKTESQKLLIQNKYTYNNQKQFQIVN